MPLIQNPTKDLLERVLSFRDARQTLIASNIANADTPAFRAFDAVLQEQIGGARPLEMRRSQEKHLSSPEAFDRVGAELEVSRAAPRLDGNNVSLDDELLKLMENRMMYQAGFELMDRWTTLSVLARDVR